MNAEIGTPAPAVSLVDAVFAELSHALARLAETGEETVVDLRSLPFGETDRESLRERLGKGEVACELEVAGRSEVHETGFSGIWWVRHYGGSGEVIVEEVVVARVPEILASHPEDITHAARRMAAMLEETTELQSTAADEEEISRG
jgi:hydrogenase-1 operon protein HyaF